MLAFNIIVFSLSVGRLYARITGWSGAAGARGGPLKLNCNMLPLLITENGDTLGLSVSDVLFQCIEPSLVDGVYSWDTKTCR